MQKLIVDILSVLKDMSIKKIIVVFVCAYPIFTVMYFKDELKLMFTNNVTEVKVSNISGVIEQTLNISDKYRPSTTSVWVYQPDGDVKEYKERVSYTGDSRNIFFGLSKIKLIGHPKVLFELRNNKYIRITKNNDYQLSRYMKGTSLEVAYIIPIKNDFGLIVAELLIGFDKDVDQRTINDIINSKEIIRLKNYM